MQMEASSYKETLIDYVMYNTAENKLWWRQTSNIFDLREQYVLNNEKLEAFCFW